MPAPIYSNLLSQSRTAAPLTAQPAPAAPAMGGVSGAFAGLNNTVSGQANRLTRNFDPNNPQLRAMLLRNARMRREAQLRRAGRSGRFFGLDPTQQRAAMNEADFGASQGVADSQNAADLGFAQSQDEFLKSLFTGQLGFERERALEKERAKTARAGGMGAAAGAIGSALIGKLPGL